MTAPIRRDSVRCTLGKYAVARNAVRFVNRVCVCVCVCVCVHRTSVIPRKGRSILLARKARGFGKGKWVGFGGKLNPGETPMQANYREMLEETGVCVDDATKCGLILFTFDCKPNLFLEVHVFCSAKSFDNVTLDDEFEGTTPTWFNENEIPFKVRASKSM